MHHDRNPLSEHNQLPHLCVQASFTRTGFPFYKYRQVGTRPRIRQRKNLVTICVSFQSSRPAAPPDVDSIRRRRSMHGAAGNAAGMPGANNCIASVLFLLRRNRSELNQGKIGQSFQTPAPTANVDEWKGIYYRRPGKESNVL